MHDDSRDNQARRSSGKSDSLANVGGSSLTLFGEALGESEVFLVLSFLSLIDGVICALVSIKSVQGDANRLPPMARAMLVIRYQARRISAMISAVDILTMVVRSSIEDINW